jgi:hypothetical protein
MPPETGLIALTEAAFLEINAPAETNDAGGGILIDFLNVFPARCQS